MFYWIKKIAKMKKKISRQRQKRNSEGSKAKRRFRRLLWRTGPWK
jgi:hypothetical protein